MNKKFILIVVSLACFLLFLTACSSGGSSRKSEVKAKNNTATLSKNTVVSTEKFSFELIDSCLVKSESDAIKDSANLYEKVSSVKPDSVKLGFDVGFKNSKPEVSKRDSYVILTINYNPDKKIKSQRESIIPKMQIKALDEKGEEVILVHNSLEEKYIDVNNPIGVLIFKVYGDTKNINFTFDGKDYAFELIK